MHNKFSAGSSVLFGLAVVMMIGGCGGSGVPDIVPMTVVVQAKGGPLNHARVRFIPLQEGLDGNYIAEGVTDENGSCELSLPGSSEPGCCACPSKILILEGPPPKDAREAYLSDGGLAIEKFKRSLKHRPIPQIYSSVAKTPLTCDPSTQESPFVIEF